MHSSTDLGWSRDVDWGSAPAWVGAVGSLLAFSLALRIYWLNSSDKRKDQARLVSMMTIGTPTRLSDTGTTISSLRSELPSTLIPRGGSHYDAVGDVQLWHLQIWNLSKETIGYVEGEILDSTDHEIVRFKPFGAIGPELDETFSLASDFEANNEVGYRVRLRFTDAAGRRWLRDHYQPVRELRPRDSRYARREV